MRGYAYLPWGAGEGARCAPRGRALTHTQPLRLPRKNADPCALLCAAPGPSASDKTNPMGRGRGAAQAYLQLLRAACEARATEWIAAGAQVVSVRFG